MAINSTSITFGKNVCSRRKKLRFTQEELAEKLGIGQQSLSRIERGQIAPKFERLIDFASTLQCSVADLFVTEIIKNDWQALDDEFKKLADAMSELGPKERKIVFALIKSLIQVLKGC